MKSQDVNGQVRAVATAYIMALPNYLAQTFSHIGSAISQEYM